MSTAWGPGLVTGLVFFAGDGEEEPADDDIGSFVFLLWAIHNGVNQRYDFERHFLLGSSSHLLPFAGNQVVSASIVPGEKIYQVPAGSEPAANEGVVLVIVAAALEGQCDHGFEVGTGAGLA